ncbi:hypothetical protein ACK3TF_003057 [Chlorella vulgaris]
MVRFQTQKDGTPQWALSGVLVACALLLGALGYQHYVHTQFRSSVAEMRFRVAASQSPYGRIELAVQEVLGKPLTELLPHYHKFPEPPLLNKGRGAVWVKVDVLSRYLKLYDMVVLLDTDVYLNYLTIPFEALLQHWNFTDSKLVVNVMDPDDGGSKNQSIIHVPSPADHAVIVGQAPFEAMLREEMPREVMAYVMILLMDAHVDVAYPDLAPPAA